MNEKFYLDTISTYFLEQSSILKMLRLQYGHLVEFLKEDSNKSGLIYLQIQFKQPFTEQEIKYYKFGIEQFMLGYIRGFVTSRETNKDEQNKNS